MCAVPIFGSPFELPHGLARLAQVRVTGACLFGERPHIAPLRPRAAPGPAASDEAVDGPSMMDRGFDAVVLRPLGAATLLLGSAVALPAIALAAPGGEEGIDNAYDVFVRTPWDNLVNAPLGRGYGL